MKDSMFHKIVKIEGTSSEEVVIVGAHQDRYMTI